MREMIKWVHNNSYNSPQVNHIAEFQRQSLFYLTPRSLTNSMNQDQQPANLGFTLVLLVVLLADLIETTENLPLSRRVSPLPIPTLSQYYYPNLIQKLRESSTTLCVKPSRTNYSEISPPHQVLKEWSHIDAISVRSTISESFCQSQLLRTYMVRKPSCQKTPPKDIRAVAHFHGGHPRCFHEKIRVYCQKKTNSYPPKDVVFLKFPFLITTSSAIVTRSGAVFDGCTIFLPMASCKPFYSHSIAIIDEGVFNTRNCGYSRSPDASLCPLPYYDDVFVMSQYDDTQIGQVERSI